MCRHAILVASLIAAAAGAAAVPELACERLGPPMIERALPLSAVTRGPGGGYVVWGAYATSDRYAALGIPLDGTAPIWVDTTAFGKGRVFMTRGADGRLYLYAGSPGRFLRWDPATGQVEDLGVPVEPATYWMGQHLDREGRWTIGVYPGPHVVSCDTRTGAIRSYGPLTDDRRQRYCTRIGVDDADGAIYASVGLHHRELWQVDPATGARRQILPTDLTAAQGSPTIWTGEDGHVYGRIGTTEFRCHPDRIEPGPTAPARVDTGRLQAGDDTVVELSAEGTLTLANAAGERRSIPVAYEGRPVTIYSVACEYQGRLWGGGLFPGLLWSMDLATGAMQSHGMVAHGAFQIYDVIPDRGGLYVASYMGCHIDLYDPAKPRKAHQNPIRIAASVPGQERPNQWERGPDGKLYFGTTPAKGRLGGALVQVDPETRTWKHWPCPLPDLSLTYLTALPETGELLACASIGGGSSAIPLAAEAAIYLWDTAKAAMTWSGKPVPGTRTYGRALRLNDGRVFGLAGTAYYLFDPVKRQVLATGDLPASPAAFPMLNDTTIGPRGIVYGIGDGAVFAFDPADNAVRIVGKHPSMDRVHGFLVTADGTLYYGSGADLWRCRLP